MNPTTQCLVRAAPQMKMHDTGFVDGMVFDREAGGYVLGCGSKVALPFNMLHLALRVGNFSIFSFLMRIIL